MYNLVFKSKYALLVDKIQLASSAMGEAPDLSRATAGQVLEQMEALNVTRAIVTDQNGCVIYDSLEDGSTEGKIALFPEVVLALKGNDTFFSLHKDGVLESTAAAPILRTEGLVGCVYFMERDKDQGSLLEALEENILWISLLLESAVIVFSFFFSSVFSRRMREIFASIGIIREGDYSHKLRVRGTDELAILAKEFNLLTERLQESEERRRQFVSDASHELKTPLTSIKLLSDSILQNEMDRETVMEFVHDIGTEADRLTRMTQKLLHLTRMDTVKEDKRELSDIAETVTKVFKMLHPVAMLHQVTLVDHTVPGATILVMEDHLYQIVFNLVENGIKYNKPGGTLTVALRREEGEWILTVTDTGVGIPKDAIPHIFERFYRVDKARSRQAGGSGLGLSIVYGMVLQNEGTICVQQPESGGSCFRLTFPAFDLEEEDLWFVE